MLNNSMTSTGDHSYNMVAAVTAPGTTGYPKGKLRLLYPKWLLRQGRSDQGLLPSLLRSRSSNPQEQHLSAVLAQGCLTVHEINCTANESR